MPSQPVNVSVDEVTDSTIAVSWSQPDNPNGDIKGYRIYFMRKNFTDVQTVRNPEGRQKFVLTDLGTLRFSLTPWKALLPSFYQHWLQQLEF